MNLTTVAEPCPQCHHGLTRPETGQPWCAACEWNLRIYDREVVPARGWRWLDRRGHQVATRLDRSLFARFSHERPTRPGWTAARAVLVAISALLVLSVLGCLSLGVWRIADRFPSWSLVPGVLLVLLAIALRPRLGRPPRRGILRRDQAPTLFALIDRIAAACGARAPSIVAVDPDFNAWIGQVGMARRTVLGLGLWLWITLTPPQRVALIAHEMGHTVSGDPNRGLVTQPALTTFRILAEATGANRTTGTLFGREFLVLMGEVALWLVSRALLLVHVGLSALAARDHQRAEYVADAIATSVAGTDGAVALADHLVLAPDIMTSIGYNANSTPPSRWRSMAESLTASRRDQVARLRQLTERRTSLWHTHPPDGLRARAIEAWPRREPQVTLGEEESSRIDQELAGWYGATHRKILGTRDYRELPPPSAPASRPATGGAGEPASTSPGCG